MLHDTNLEKALLFSSSSFAVSHFDTLGRPSVDSQGTVADTSKDPSIPDIFRVLGLSTTICHAGRLRPAVLHGHLRVSR